MRGIIVACVVLLATVALAEKDDHFKKMKTIVDDCVKELDVKRNDKGHPDMEDAEKKCLAKCIGIRAEFMDESGKLLFDNIPEKMKTKLKECDEKVKETDACKRANEIAKCAKPKHKGRRGKNNKEE